MKVSGTCLGTVQSSIYRAKLCTDQYILVYTGIYWDILVQALYRLVYTALYCVQTSIYKYRLVYTQIYFYVQDFVEHIVMQ